VTCLVPGFPRQARTDQRESADRIDPALAAEATESTDAAEKTEPIDKIEPAEPIDKTDPAEPIDKMDPLEPIDKIDPLEPMLRMDPSLFRMESFSQGPRPSRKVSTVPLPGRARPRRGRGGLVGERPHLVGYLRVHRSRQVMPDPGQDDEPGTTDRRGGAPRGGGAQQRVLRAVQDQRWQAELGQPAAVPFRAGLTALCSGVADAADLVPLGHPAHFLLVEGIGR
jgi:hypothetical protein